MISHNNTIIQYARKFDKLITIGKRNGKCIFCFIKGLSVEAYKTITNTYGYSCLPELGKYLRLKPELIPYVNEDPHIVCSLVNTGYRRWIVTDGNSFFNTALYPTSYPVVIKTRIYIPQLSSTAEKNVFGTYNGNGTFVFGYRNNQWYMHSSSAWHPAPLVTEEEHDIKYNLKGYSGREFTIDNIIYESTLANTQSMGSTGIPLGIFSGRGDSIRCPADSGCRVTHVEVLCNNEKHHYIPFKTNGEMEMLDIEDLHIIERVGNFTEIFTGIN